MNNPTKFFLLFLFSGAFTLLTAEETKKELPAPAEKKEKAEKEENLEHGHLSTQAWLALNAGNHDEAIKLAELCIKEHRKSAENIEEKLEKEKAVLPTGEVTDEEKATINENGLLNDVAACYFILGKSQAAKEDKDAAKKTFTTLKELGHARVWDPQGWFWSPAANTADEILFLN